MSTWTSSGVSAFRPFWEKKWGERSGIVGEPFGELWMLEFLFFLLCFFHGFCGYVGGGSEMGTALSVLFFPGVLGCTFSNLRIRIF